MEELIPKVQDVNSSKVSDFIKSFWPLLVALVAIAVAWGSNNTRATANEMRITNLEASQDKINETLTEVRVSQGRLEASVGNVLNILKN